MPLHNGLLPREGFCADVIFKLINKTALNPSLLLPLLLLARYTKRGQDLSILHPKLLRTLTRLLYVSVAGSLGSWYSSKVRNNWVSDKYDWSREIVLVTGGAGGIGGSIVKLFEELGITVVVLDVQPMSFATSSKVHYYQCDIRSPERLVALAEKIRREVGDPTVVINNAGVARGKTVLEAQPGDIRFTFDVNTLAPFWTAKAFLPSMVARNHGMIVTVSSYASWLTIPNMVDYGASKAGALAFHEGITAELTTRYNAPKVRTVIVHPGHTKTPLFTGYDQKTDFIMPQLEPESIAEAVVRQVLSGNSGRVVLPKGGHMLPALRLFPDWYSIPVRAKAQSYMAKFSGRQVVKDVDAPYDESSKESQSTAGSESTVLVSKE
ncbi:Dehydrogenase RED2 [Paramyrothecium foliicola]|nr:Dehydrogenase RED2 [Paramyrothecium foliicola]